MSETQQFIPFFDLSRQIEENRNLWQEAFDEVIDAGIFLSGKQVNLFEVEFGNWIGSRGVAACASGTCALELILRAWEIGPGDEVIVPANTWVSDAEVVILVGATPVFADVDLYSGQITPETVEPCITSHTKAIIAVHMYGSATDIVKLRELVHDREIYILEDCAHAIGLQTENGKAGTLGDAAAFSFYPTKNMGAFGDAGCVVSDDYDLIDKVKLLRDHGQLQRNVHKSVGITGRMDELQASVLRRKLLKIDRWNSRRREIARFYLQELNKHQDLSPGSDFEGQSVVHLFIIQTQRRDELKNYLDRHNVGTAIHYPIPLPLIPVFGPYGNRNKYPHSIKRSNEILSIPVFPELRDHEVEYIGSRLRHFSQKKETS